MIDRLVLKTLWQKWLVGFIFWTLVGLFFSIQAYYYFSDQQQNYTYWDALKGTLPQWYLWGMLAPLFIKIDRNFNVGRESILNRALLHLPLSVFWTIAYVIIEAFSDHLVYGQMPMLSLSYIAGEFQWNLPNYWFIVGFYVAYEYYNEFRDRELKASQLEAQLAKAHLQSLKMQLQPHFLFNTLNTISAHMEKNPKTARRMIAHLGELLRFSLEKENQQEITLAEEISFIENYLEIQRIRFEDQLQIELQIDPEIFNALVPSLMIQPLVENAIKHGISSRVSKGLIKISAQRQNGQLHIQVQDNGVGLSKDWHRSNGVGLANTIERLTQLYNGTHRFEIKNAAEGGVIVDISLPFRLGRRTNIATNYQ